MSVINDWPTLTCSIQSVWRASKSTLSTSLWQSIWIFSILLFSSWWLSLDQWVVLNTDWTSTFSFLTFVDNELGLFPFEEKWPLNGNKWPFPVSRFCQPQSYAMKGSSIMSKALQLICKTIFKGRYRPFWMRAALNGLLRRSGVATKNVDWLAVCERVPSSWCSSEWLLFRGEIWQLQRILREIDNCRLYSGFVPEQLATRAERRGTINHALGDTPLMN